MPPAEIRDRVLQKIRWDEGNAYSDPSSNYTFINIQPKDGNHITVHRWWKIFFIIFFIMSKVFLFLAIFYYLKYRMSQEQRSDNLHQMIRQEQTQSPLL
jgi:heme/copper-type cytochrome/quinol oxidase subunit 3